MKIALESEKENGTTVVSQGLPNSLEFMHPTAVMMDDRVYLYIADNHNHRFIRLNEEHWQCLSDYYNEQTIVGFEDLI